MEEQVPKRGGSRHWLPVEESWLAAPTTRTAIKSLSSMGVGSPSNDGLRYVEWNAFTPKQIAAIVCESVKKKHDQTWLGVKQGGWIRDAFVISAMEIWDEKILRQRLGRACFSPSIALRAVYGGSKGTVLFLGNEFQAPSRREHFLVHRINKDFWTPAEVLEESHGLYTGGLVVAQVLCRAGAPVLGASIVNTLHAHRKWILELLGSSLGSKRVIWTE